MRSRLPEVIAAAGLACISISSMSADESLESTDRGKLSATPYIEANVTSKEPNRMVNRPTTPIELLRNIKFAMEHDLLLREDFYSDENLKRLFGWEQVHWADNRTQSKSGSTPIGPHGASRNGSLYPIFDINFKRTDGGSPSNNIGKVRGSGGMAIEHDTRLTSELVQEVFGANMDVGNPYKGDNPKHPTPLARQTHALGNRLLKYQFSSTSGNGFVAFILNGDGTVNRINFVEEEK